MSLTGSIRNAKKSAGGGGAVAVYLAGIPVVAVASILNFIQGAGIALTVTDAGGGQVNVTVAASGGGAGVTTFNGRNGAVVPVAGDYTVAQVTGAAPLASPALTGVPTAPTAAPATNTTQVATTAFVIANAAAGSVTSVFGRIGAVVAAANDYLFSQLASIPTTLAGYGITDPIVTDPVALTANRLVKATGAGVVANALADETAGVLSPNGPVQMARNEFRRPLLVDVAEKMTAKGAVTGAQSFDFSVTDAYSLTLTGNVTATLLNPPATGSVGWMSIACTGDGVHAITFPGTVTSPAGPIPTPGNGELVLYQLYTNDATNYTLSFTRVVTGTPSATTFLAGDGAYKVPPGSVIKISVVTAGVTFTTQPNTKQALVEGWGGGGGGGGIANGGAASAGSGGGGAAGSYVRKFYTALTGSTAYTIAIGAAGTGGVAGNNAGTAGGNTTFTDGVTQITASGGNGGPGNTATGTGAPLVLGGTGVASINGDINGIGSAGERSTADQSAGTVGAGARGADSAIGAGGNTRISAGAGNPGLGNGAGGAAGLVLNNSASAAGGNGSGGLLLITEYA